MCYISMDSSRQGLQTNGKLIWKFKFGFELLTENRFYQTFGRKLKNIWTNSEAWILIRLKLKFFSNFGIIFRFSNIFFFIIVVLPWVYASEVGEAFVLISTCSSFSLRRDRQKNFIWASRLRVGRRYESILGYISKKNYEKRNSWLKGLIINSDSL